MSRRGLPGGPLAGDHRAVSDTLGYVFTFAVVFTSIGAVLFGGLNGLESLSETSQDGTAVRTFENVRGEFTDLRDGSRNRSTFRMDLSGDSLAVRTSTITVGVDNDPDPATDVNHTVDVNALVRRTDDGARIVYANGATFRVFESGSVVDRQPSFRCGADSAHVPLVDVGGDFDISASGTVTVDALRTGHRSLYPNITGGQAPAASNVTVNVTETAHPTAWNELFTRRLGRWAGSNGTYYCDGIARAFVPETTVRVDVL